MCIPGVVVHEGPPAPAVPVCGGEALEEITTGCELRCWELLTSSAKVTAAPVIASASEVRFDFLGWLSNSRKVGMVSVSVYFPELIILAQQRSWGMVY